MNAPNKGTQKTYKESHTLEERKRRVAEQLEKYPNMIPIIVERGKKCNLPDLQKVKYDDFFLKHRS